MTKIATIEREHPKPGDALDCGHIAAEYALWDGKTTCYPCMDTRARENMYTHDDVMAYLSDADPSLRTHTNTHLTTWTGGYLARGTRLWRVRNNMAGWIWRFQAVDDTGAHWYGTSPGPGMYARMHRAKHAPR